MSIAGTGKVLNQNEVKFYNEDGGQTIIRKCQFCNSKMKEYSTRKDLIHEVSFLPCEPVPICLVCFTNKFQRRIKE